MKVRYDEGLAIRIGPEPCVGTREDAGEASAGEHIGQPLSRESLKQSGSGSFDSNYFRSRHMPERD